MRRRVDGSQKAAGIGDGTPILDIRARQQVLPRARWLHAPHEAGARRQRRDDRHQARRDAGTGRRVRLRQVHAWPAGAAPRRSDGRRDPFRQYRHRPSEAQRDGRRAQEDAGDLPGSLLVAQSAHDGRPDHRRADVRARDPAQGQDPAARRRAAAAGGPLSLHGAALSPRAVGRAAPARRHRPGAGGRAARDHLRRGGLGARRVDPGPGDQPAGGPAAEAGPDLPVHRPRPGRGAAHLDQGGRHVSGAHRRVRGRRRAVRQSEAPLHARRCWRRRPIPDPVIERTRPRTIIKGELPSPLNPPVRLRVPSALSAGDRGVQEGSAGRAGAWVRGIWWPASMHKQCNASISSRASTGREK